MARLDPNVGVVTRDLAEWTTYWEDAFRSALGEDLATDPETVVGQWIGVLAIAFTEADEGLLDIAQGFNPTTASAIQLTSLGSLYHLARRGATRSEVTLTLGGVAGAVVPANARVRDDAGNQWYLVAQATIGSGGTVDAAFKAVEFGVVEAAVGTITQIVTVRAGWETVTNAAAATPGRAIEAVDDFRHRQQHHAQYNAKAMAEAMDERVAEVEGVTHHRVEENATNTQVVRQGLTIPANAVMVVALGGDDEDIGAAIRATKPAGIPTAGDTTVTVEGTDYLFQRISSVSLQVDVTIETLPGFPSDGVLRIRNALTAWVADLEVGAGVDTGRIYEALNSVPGFVVTELTVREDPVRVSGGVLYGASASTSDISTALSGFTSISDGSFRLGSEDFTGLNLSAVTTFDGLATALQTEIRTGSTTGFSTATVRWDPNTRRFVLGLPDIDASSTDYGLAAHGSGTGTDVSALFKLTTSTGLLQFARPPKGDERFTLEANDTTVSIG